MNRLPLPLCLGLVLTSTVAWADDPPPRNRPLFGLGILGGGALWPGADGGFTFGGEARVGAWLTDYQVFLAGSGHYGPGRTSTSYLGDVTLNLQRTFGADSDLDNLGFVRVGGGLGLGRGMVPESGVPFVAGTEPKEPQDAMGPSILLGAGFLRGVEENLHMAFEAVYRNVPVGTVNGGTGRAHDLSLQVSLIF